MQEMKVGETELGQDIFIEQFYVEQTRLGVIEGFCDPDREMALLEGFAKTKLNIQEPKILSRLLPDPYKVHLIEPELEPLPDYYPEHFHKRIRGVLPEYKCCAALVCYDITSNGDPNYDCMSWLTIAWFTNIETSSIKDMVEEALKKISWDENAFNGAP